MKLSLFDAFFYSLMVGTGEVYFLANAVRLGASHAEQALVVTLPLCLGALGPWLALAASRRVRRRRPVAVAGASLQATTLAALVLTDHLGVLSPAVLIGFASAYQIFGQGTGTVWSSWFGDVVPAKMRGRYFARRNRVAYVGTCASMIAAGAALHLLEPGAAASSQPDSGHGFALIFGAAALFRLASSIVLWASPEPRPSPKPTASPMLEIVRGERLSLARRMLLTAASLQLTVYLASPYFGPFMLDELKLPYLSYTLASVSVVAMKFLSLHSWGRAIDRYGARSVYLLGILLVALVPIPWLWANGLAVVIVAQMLSGFSWAGFEVSHFSLLLEATPKDVRLHVFAGLSTLNGMAQLVGGLLGAQLLAASPPGAAGFAVVFGVSAALRVLMAAAAPTLIPESLGAQGIGRGRLLLRILGVRPSGGVVFRPLTVLASNDSDGEEPL